MKPPPSKSRPGRAPSKRQDRLTLAFVAVLHRERERQRLTERRLARRARVSVSEISELEHRHYSPTVKTSGRLARGLRRRLSTLLRRAEDTLRRRSR
jgi:transcriptional regulator with XRE-family HTH domain